MATNSFDRLEEEYDVSYLLPGNTELKNYPNYDDILIEKHWLFKDKKVIVHNFDSKNYFLRAVLKRLFVIKNAKNSETYATAFYNEKDKLRKKKFVLYKLCSYKWLYFLLTNVIEFFIPLNRELINKIRTLNPFLILLPVSAPGNEEIDLLKIRRKLKISYGVIPLSWDNVSSKLYLYLNPDFILERGEQNADFARKIFNLDHARVSIVGVPHYQMFLDYQKASDLAQKRKLFLSKLAIPDNKKVLLFGGSIRPFDETSFLEKLDKAIDFGELRDTYVIYRPHPERDKRIQERSFFDINFKYVVFDEELKKSYLTHKSNYIPDLNNYLDLYNSIDALVCPPTSLIVEAALFGKPTLALVCDDGVHMGWTSAQKIIDREHFKIWKSFDWFVRCYDKENFIEDCKKLIAILRMQGMSDKIKKDVSYIVHSDDRSYQERIVDAVKKWDEGKSVN